MSPTLARLYSLIESLALYAAFLTLGLAGALFLFACYLLVFPLRWLEADVDRRDTWSPR